MDDIFSVLKPGDGARLTVERQLARWAERFAERHPTGFYYYGIGDFLQQHGRQWQGAQPCPPQYDAHRGPEQQCYPNALKAAEANPELRYVEGVYLVGGQVLNHGWCIDPDDNVIELTVPVDEIEGLGIERTWIPIGENSPAKINPDPLDRWVYYGCVFDAAEVREFFLDHSLPMLDDHLPEFFKRPWRPT